MTTNQPPSCEVALHLKIMRFSTKKETKISRPFSSHYFHHCDVWTSTILPQGRAGEPYNKMMPVSPLQTFASRTLLLRHTWHITQGQDSAALSCLQCTFHTAVRVHRTTVTFDTLVGPHYQGDSHRMDFHETSHLIVPPKYPALFRFRSRSYHNNRYFRRLQSLVTVSLYRRDTVLCAVRAAAEGTVLILRQTDRLKKQLSIEY